jgi:hypothetical protein
LLAEVWSFSLADVRQPMARIAGSQKRGNERLAPLKAAFAALAAKKPPVPAPKRIRHRFGVRGFRCP